MKAPAWSRLLYRVSRGLNVLHRGQQILRDELLLAFLAPNQREALTYEAYAHTTTYLEGGEYFSLGLLAWEAALLDDPRIPRSGRVLLPAAGGGRELRALLERGYEVYAFEPVARLLDSARAVAQGAKALVTQASYGDLVARANGERGALDGLQGPFDFCVLGWTSLSHLNEPSAVLEVLRALRTIAPRAPVMTSFFSRSSAPAPTLGGARKLRRLLRRAFARASGRVVAKGLEFQTDVGFTYAFSREELLDLCERAGYELALFSELDYPHALLLPKGAADAGRG